ncbi:MAG: glycerophosphodiester phosphodiesterase [Ruminococcaceae bacterium]|nr:glycerophosphodiester phosphodiesterase [Oscillospiraceae bacterium]MBQ9913023.1 glycerophosphodiester phosphodiesterase [Clostridia bacterium]
MIKLPELFTVTAHTGCEGTKDNSLEAIKKGAESGADIIEFDLRFDKDGNGILSHDETEDKAVTLEEAFELVSSFDGLKVNVDCKTTDNLSDVYRLSERYGITDRIFYTGIEEKDVAAAKTQTPEISYFLNFKAKSLKKKNEKYISSLISLVKEKGAVGINLRHSQCSKKMVEMFRAEGLLVSVWTANSTRVMKKCLSFSPDNITTRYPSALLDMINNLK